MKKLILFLSFMSFFQSQIIAQIIAPVRDTYNITFTRDDNFIGETVPGHAHTNVTLDIKIGSNIRTNTFLPDVVSSKDYNFPVIYLLPGSPAPVTYVNVTFSTPSLQSGYYELGTHVGDETIIPPVTYYTGQFGYGVAITCIATNKYLMRITRFECNLCIPGGGIPVTKTANPQNTPQIAPNPSMGLSELYYTAAGKETVSINIADINGKTINAYSKDLEAGLQKLPIDIQNHLSGTYIVQWRSSTGKTGSLKLVKK
ncbi:T9SS type A sorting domain-containing protein [Chryseobacterium sp. LAM-KRS1]|uniref:T9SS type A sorting domain-containing protein n=1 Tax=Chryseobacterium sp. LAM-KRS1 TaxID=2715754 RepID=UPI001557BA14|nr:T9SS type A sorting domain-containing protein [Chryseobacterium sp. LAM-KRS1]